MTDIKELRSKMLKKDISVEKLASMTGISKDTLYRRIKNNGEDFTCAEVQAIARALELTEDEIMIIFFAHNVA